MNYQHKDLAMQLEDLAALGDTPGLLALLSEQEPETAQYHAVRSRMYAVRARMRGNIQSACVHELDSERWLTKGGGAS